MPLSLDQRRDRLRARIGELEPWRLRDAVLVEGWTCDGAPIALGAAWPSREGVRRFEARAEPPREWPSAQTELSLDFGGESLLTLSYADGRSESFGLDANHEAFPLRGGAFAITVESVARLAFGQPAPAPALRRAALLWIDGEVEALRLLLSQIVEAAATLGDDEATPHLIEAGEAALRGLDWPSLTRDYVARMSSAPKQQSIWRLPPVEHEPAALDEAQRASVAAAHRALRERLQALRRRFPPRGKVALTGHAHIDLAWLWPYEETRRKLRRTFHTTLSLLERSPDFRFNQSTAQYYAQIEEDDPALFQAIRARVREGRWEPLGAMWVEPDANMPTGESLVRQLLYGQRYFERAFGKISTVCWLPDCFGFSPALPQLLRQAGVESFFTIKVNWSETNRFPHDLFWWEGLDGSRVLAHTFDNPLGGYNGRVQPDGLAPTWRNFRGKVAHDETLLAVGFGDGGGGVTPEMIAREVQLRDFPALPEARWTRVDAFFARAHETAKATTLPRWSGEIYLELHRGVLTTQSAAKRLHRRAERALITAETAAALACLGGAQQPVSLEPTWRIVLKNAFHDILPGSSIREVYQDAEAELGRAIEVAEAAQSAALDALLDRAPAGASGDGLAGASTDLLAGASGDGLAILNPTFAPRPLDVRLGGAALSTGDMIPPLSLRILVRSALVATPGLRVGERGLENAHLRVELAADGTLSSLVHKPTGREALEGRGNQLWVYRQDKPRNWDAWDIEEDYAESGEEIDSFESCEIVERGPHYASLQITRRWRASLIVQTLGLAANGRRLDIATHLDWRDRRTLLRTLTPAAVRARFATFECAFGVIERPTHANTTWDAAMFEAAAHRFIDISEPGFGLALLNDGKYGHSARDGVLGLSLVRSPIYPDPLADEGPQDFTYALMPHGGDWREGGVREEAEALNQPLLVRPVNGSTETTWTPLRVEGVAAALAALKPAEDGDGLVLRLYEPGGARGSLDLAPPPGWRVAGPLDLLERPAARAPGADLRPFEVRSWRLSRG